MSSSSSTTKQGQKAEVEHTPLAVLTKYFESRKEKPNSKTPVVLLSTGSYNPVHRKHVEIFVKAKKLLESQFDFEVACAFISPSHDSYVSNKLGADAIKSVDRLKMVDLAIEEEGVGSWLCADRWEAEGVNYFCDFPEVTMRLSKHLHDRFPKETFRVLYVCGADHFVKCGGLRSLRRPELGVVVLTRPGYTKVPTDVKTNLFAIEIDATESDVSSTMIRKRIMVGKSINDLTYNNVEKYIIDNKLLRAQV